VGAELRAACTGDGKRAAARVCVCRSESDPAPAGYCASTLRTENRLHVSLARQAAASRSRLRAARDRNAVLVSECYGAGSALVEDGKAVWTNAKFGTHFMTRWSRTAIVWVDGHGPADAFLCCLDWKTGKELWRAKPAWQETIATKDGPREVEVGTVRCSLAAGGRALPGTRRIRAFALAGFESERLPRTGEDVAVRGAGYVDAASPEHGLLYVCQTSGTGFMANRSGCCATTCARRSRR